MKKSIEDKNQTDVNFDKNLNLLNNIDIDIKKLLSELETIGDEKQKDEFIKNYTRIKEQINIVDQILNEHNDTQIQEFEKNKINELFDILEKNEYKIFDSKSLNITELKTLMVICNVLENKINNDTMNIIEFK